jgi:hypothetical protein
VQHTIWENGRQDRFHLKSDVDMPDLIREAETTDDTARVYVTDCSRLAYSSLGYPVNAPGVACAVDEETNANVPMSHRTCRPTNVLNFLKVESLGTRTWTCYDPISHRGNVTAFHYETKKRRSYNLGSGDYIIQPIATAPNNRLLQRVHAAVTGNHSRHSQLLPLECYLEAGVHLVTHIREDTRSPSLVEVCEESMHAFVTFADATCSPRPFKVACNDFELTYELATSYFLERLSRSNAVSINRSPIPRKRNLYPVDRTASFSSYYKLTTFRM